MKKLIKAFALTIFCAFALSGYAFADVAVAPMLITFGLIFLLIAAIVIIALVLIIKLIMKLRKRNGK